MIKKGQQFLIKLGQYSDKQTFLVEAMQDLTNNLGKQLFDEIDKYNGESDSCLWCDEDLILYLQRREIIKLVPIQEIYLLDIEDLKEIEDCEPRTIQDYFKKPEHAYKFYLQNS